MGSGLGLGDLFKLGAMLVDAASQDSQVNQTRDTEEYQNELQNNIEELKEMSDVKLLYDFHKEYDDQWGKDYL